MENTFEGGEGCGYSSLVFEKSLFDWTKGSKRGDTIIGLSYIRGVEGSVESSDFGSRWRERQNYKRKRKSWSVNDLPGVFFALF